MTKQILFDAGARGKMKKGVDILANSVKVTFGPKGRNVVIGKNSAMPKVTQDGVTIANEIKLSDAVEDIGAQLAKGLIDNTLKAVRDGSTTAIVIAQALINGSMESIAAGANPLHLTRGIDKAVKAVSEGLKNQSMEIGNDLKKIREVAGLFAGGDDSLGKLITDAIARVGKDGSLPSKNPKTKKRR